MNGEEYRELAALWGDTAPADDQSEVARLARRTPARARVAQWSELVLVLLLGAIITAMMALSLAPASVLVGALLLGLLAWSGWKRHRLANLALLIDERDRLSFIGSSVRAKEAELTRSAHGLALIVPGSLITMLLGYAFRHPGGEVGLGPFLLNVLTTPRGLIIAASVLCAVVILGRSHRRVRSELAHLRRLHEAYVEEGRRDDSASG